MSFTAEEKKEYVAAVIKKQAGVDVAKAASMAGKLSAEQFAKLHDAGREGRVQECRDIIATL